MIITSAVEASIQAVSPLFIRGLPPNALSPGAHPDVSRRLGILEAADVAHAGARRFPFGGGDLRPRARRLRGGDAASVRRVSGPRGGPRTRTRRCRGRAG